MCAANAGDVIAWLNAPFAQKADRVAVLGANGDQASHLQVSDMGIVAIGLREFTSFGNTYWCVTVGLKNFSSSTDSYNLFEFKLLTPSGRIDGATYPLINDASSLLSSGELASNGSANGQVCYDAPSAQTGRFAVVYEPISFTSDSRALFYFDH